MASRVLMRCAFRARGMGANETGTGGIHGTGVRFQSIRAIQAEEHEGGRKGVVGVHLQPLEHNPEEEDASDFFGSDYLEKLDGYLYSDEAQKIHENVEQRRADMKAEMIVNRENWIEWRERYRAGIDPATGEPFAYAIKRLDIPEKAQMGEDERRRLLGVIHPDMPSVRPAVSLPREDSKQPIFFHHLDLKDPRQLLRRRLQKDGVLRQWRKETGIEEWQKPETRAHHLHLSNPVLRLSIKKKNLMRQMWTEMRDDYELQQKLVIKYLRLRKEKNSAESPDLTDSTLVLKRRQKRRAAKANRWALATGKIIPPQIDPVPIGNSESILEPGAATQTVAVAAPTEEDAHVLEIQRLGEGHWWESVPRVYLRDACTCSACVDPYSTNRNFQSTDIPSNIAIREVELLSNNSLRIFWDRDYTLPSSKGQHTTVLPADFLSKYGSREAVARDCFHNEKPVLWDKDIVTRDLQYIDFRLFNNEKFPNYLYLALEALTHHGLVIIRGVPPSVSVDKIALRIGTLRDSFYGRTWDVKSKPQAENVAYTDKFLGLHMDLLYMADPPAFQFLLCKKNTAEGGESIFSDAYHSASQLSEDHFRALVSGNLTYHYQNGGEHYHHRHRVIELDGAQNIKFADRALDIKCMNYSPPFQGVSALPTEGYLRFMEAFRALAKSVESEQNLYEYKLQEGECVIFNNRRVLHGRRKFSVGIGGAERWLEGCYIDSDVFMSSWRTMRERYENGEFMRDVAGQQECRVEHGRRYVHRPAGPGFGTLPGS